MSGRPTSELVTQGSDAQARAVMLLRVGAAWWWHWTSPFARCGAQLHGPYASRERALDGEERHGPQSCRPPVPDDDDRDAWAERS